MIITELIENKSIEQEFDKKIHDILTISEIFVNQNFFNFLNSIKKKKVIFNVFYWTFGGNGVYITGEWDSWNKRIPLCKSGNEFFTIIPLTYGKFQYKFTVDGEWKFAPSTKIQEDKNGNLNNFIDIHDNFGSESIEQSFSDLEIENFNLGESMLEKEFRKDPPLIPSQLISLVETKKKKLSVNSHQNEFLNLYQNIRVFLNHLIFFDFNCKHNHRIILPLVKIRIKNKFFTLIVNEIKLIFNKICNKAKIILKNLL